MSGPPAAPWTEIGRLQADVQHVESALRRKVERHELDSAVAQVRGRVACLERTVEELRAETAGLRSRLHELEAAASACQIGEENQP